LGTVFSGRTFGLELRAALLADRVEGHLCTPKLGEAHETTSDTLSPAPGSLAGAAAGMIHVRLSTFGRCCSAASRISRAASIRLGDGDNRDPPSVQPLPDDVVLAGVRLTKCNPVSGIPTCVTAELAERVERVRHHRPPRAMRNQQWLGRKTARLCARAVQGAAWRMAAVIVPPSADEDPHVRFREAILVNKNRPRV